MAQDISQVVQKKLNYCIVDEVDSILIDEAKTPLIIAGVGQVSETTKYSKATILSTILKSNIHYDLEDNRLHDNHGY